MLWIGVRIRDSASLRWEEPPVICFLNETAICNEQVRSIPHTLSMRATLERVGGCFVVLPLSDVPALTRPTLTRLTAEDIQLVLFVAFTVLGRDFEVLLFGRRALDVAR